MWLCGRQVPGQHQQAAQLPVAQAAAAQAAQVLGVQAAAALAVQMAQTEAMLHWLSIEHWRGRGFLCC